MLGPKEIAAAAVIRMLEQEGHLSRFGGNAWMPSDAVLLALGDEVPARVEGHRIICRECLGFMEYIDIDTPEGMSNWVNGVVQDEEAAEELLARIITEGEVIINTHDPEFIERYTREWNVSEVDGVDDEGGYYNNAIDNDLPEPEAWKETHRSKNDFSGVRIVSQVPFIIENEDGEQWEDDPALWEVLPHGD